MITPFIIFLTSICIQMLILLGLVSNNQIFWLSIVLPPSSMFYRFGTWKDSSCPYFSLIFPTFFVLLLFPTFFLQVAKQDSRHRSPEKGRDAEYTYSSEIGTVKMDRPCYQNAWWTFAKENPLWRTSNRKTLPWWSEEAIQGHPQSLP